jgi:hypothetical protein
VKPAPVRNAPKPMPRRHPGTGSLSRSRPTARRSGRGSASPWSHRID